MVVRVVARPAVFQGLMAIVSQYAHMVMVVVQVAVGEKFLETV